MKMSLKMVSSAKICCPSIIILNTVILVQLFKIIHIWCCVQMEHML